MVSVRAALQSDKSFASYDEAIAHLLAPGLPAQTEFFWSQGLLDVLFEYPIRSDQSRFSIDPRLARLGIRTLTVLRFLPPAGAVRGFEFPGDPGLVQLDPALAPGRGAVRHARIPPHARRRRSSAVPGVPGDAVPPRLVAGRRGDGLRRGALDHADRVGRRLAPDALWFPPLIDTLIAASIVYMALENIVFAAQKEPQSTQSTQRKNHSLRSPRALRFHLDVI